MTAPLRCRILAADDDADFLEAIATALTAAGASVVTATTGAELLEQVAEGGAFDVVITDVSMPWMTGLQVACAMREAGLDVPVIVLTGLADLDMPARVRALGEHAVLLRKPCDTAHLIAAVVSAGRAGRETSRLA